MAPTPRVELCMRTLALARDCAALGARVRTIHHLTGLRPRDLHRLLFTEHAPPPRGRAPDTRDWYHTANLLCRIEASVIVSNFRRLRVMGFSAADALVASYRYYQSVYRPPYRISFDRAFDLASHTEGLWIAKSSVFQVQQCLRCGSEYLAAIGAAPRADRLCPFCQLINRHERDPRLTASVAVPVDGSSEAISDWLRRTRAQPRIDAEPPRTRPRSRRLDHSNE